MGTLRREAVRPEMATAMAQNPGRRDVEDWGAELLRHTGVSWLYLCVCCVLCDSDKVHRPGAARIVYCSAGYTRCRWFWIHNDNK